MLLAVCIEEWAKALGALEGNGEEFFVLIVTIRQSVGVMLGTIIFIYVLTVIYTPWRFDSENENLVFISAHWG